jgi:hypothetical protein
MSLPPANWYPAPDDPSRDRWWNGAEWSDTFRPAGQAAVPAPPAYGQPQPYMPVYGQQQYGAAAPKNNLAIAGLIVSIGSLLIGIYGVAAIVGIALSGAGRSRARQAAAAGGVEVGKSAATAGIIVGIVSLVLNVGYLVWLANNPYFFSSL